MRITNLPKLLTHEDPLHLHKTLGIGCLAHYGYRAYHAYASPVHSMGFDPHHPSTPACILLHLALSMSSLAFTIPRNRVRKLPMIWPEFRLHSILFASRSLLAMLCFWAHAVYGMPAFQYARGLLVLATLACADAVTFYYKKMDQLLPGETTMRSMPFPDGTPLAIIRTTNMYYSVSQVLATMNILFVPSMDRPFAVLFPIQLAAFLMTMVRKSILTAGEWHVLYAAALGLNFVHAAMTAGESTLSTAAYWTLAATFAALRFACRANKYFLWTGVVAVFAYTVTPT